VEPTAIPLTVAYDYNQLYFYDAAPNYPRKGTTT
jgi:hypothetical protein